VYNCNFSSCRMDRPSKGGGRHAGSKHDHELISASGPVS
jgi:hypothetical protein